MHRVFSTVLKIFTTRISYPCCCVKVCSVWCVRVVAGAGVTDSSEVSAAASLQPAGHTGCSTAGIGLTTAAAATFITGWILDQFCRDSLQQTEEKGRMYFSPSRYVTRDSFPLPRVTPSSTLANLQLILQRRYNFPARHKSAGPSVQCPGDQAIVAWRKINILTFSSHGYPIYPWLRVNFIQFSGQNWKAAINERDRRR